MKKFIVSLFLFIVLPFGVNADTISNINIEVNLKNDGSAEISEAWEVKATEGTEWCKLITNLKNETDLYNYTVLMDGKSIEEKTWDPNDKLEDKANHYGIKYTSEGIELCFGKKDMNKHIFILNYSISNFMTKVKDSQVLQWTLLHKINAENVDITIKSEKEIPKSTDVIAYGYDGNLTIKDGKIKISSKGGIKDEYVTILAKFPSETFKITHESEEKTFEEILEIENSQHKVKVEKSNGETISNILLIIGFIVFFGLGILIVIKYKEKFIEYIKNIKNKVKK